MSHVRVCVRSRMPRGLRLELLESRELLTVSLPHAEQFKHFSFSGANPTLSVNGTWTVHSSQYGNQPIGFKSTAANISGVATYTSPTDATISDIVFSGAGTWAAKNAPSMFHGTFALTGGTITQGADHSGTFSGQASANASIVQTPSGSVLLDSPIDGPVGGTINGPKETINLRYKQGDVNLTIAGPIQPNPSSQSFDIQVPTPATSAWTPSNGLTGPALAVHVDVPGGVFKATSKDKAVSYSSPVATYVKLYWATGTTYASRVGSALADKIPIHWNEASADYTISNLPLPPASAKYLLFVKQFNGRPAAVAGYAPLPARPVLSINDVLVNKSTTTVQASFTVSLTGSSLWPVTVSYVTANGSSPDGAKSPSDYQKTSGKLTFISGANNRTLPISVSVKGNTKVVPDKTFFVRLTKATWGTLGDAQGVGTIHSAASAARNAALTQWSAADAAVAAAYATATANKPDAAAVAALDAVLAGGQA